MARRTGHQRVEIRARSIRIRFSWKGKRMNETIRVDGRVLPPTAANMNYAHRLAARLERALELGTFDLAEFFPESAHLPAKAPVDRPTFGQRADDWFISKGQLTDATRDQYKNGVALWKRLLDPDKPIEDYTFQELAKVVGGHKWRSAKSANNYLIVLRGVFEYHYAGPLSAQNPMAGVRNLSVVRKKPDPLTPDERDAILAYMGEHYDPRIAAYFQFAFYTGMRPEELIALQWGDIDFRIGIATVRRVRTFRGSEREGSKTHSIRDVDLVPQAMDALKAMRPYTFMKGVDAEVFEHPVELKPWHDERSQRDTYWKPCLRALGLRQRRAYATRHTFATVALMGGVRPAYVSEQMGHTDTRMFFEVYARWINGVDKGLQRKLMAEAFSTTPPRRAEESIM